MSLAKIAQLSESKLDKDLLYMIDEDLSVEEDKPKENEVVISVSENDSPEEISFELPEVPGSENQSAVELEVEEEPEVEVTDAGPWGWREAGIDKFPAWLKNKMDNPPKHDGISTSGIERCIAYFQKLNSIISQAVRIDVDEVLNVGSIEKAREEIHKAIDRLEERLNRLNSNKFKKKKKANDESTEGFVKEAQKAAGVYGRIMVTVPLLESHVARVIINSVVSAGKSAEDIFEKLAKKYDLTLREKVSVIKILQDIGFASKHR